MKYGRPVIKAPSNFPEIVEKWENGILKAYEAAEMCGMWVDILSQAAGIPSHIE